LRDLINDAMSCDFLTIEGNAFQSLLDKNEKYTMHILQIKEG